MELPLAGVRIITLAEQYPGPFATLLMADLGADVTMVERISGGDPSRQFPAFHTSLNRNKRSIALDLKSESGREALRRLIQDADVLMEGFRPGTMARLGFDYGAAAAINPRLVYLSISGFGQAGPYRDRPAHDLSYQAIAGLLFRQAETGEPERQPDLAIGDLSSAMFAVVGTLSALVQRAASGRGTYVDLSMTDCLVSWMTTFLQPVLNGGSYDSIGAEPGYGTFKCADGRLLTLSIAHEDWFWEPFCTVIGMTAAAGLRRSQRLAQAEELSNRISARLLEKPLGTWGELFDRAGIPWGPVNTLEDVLADPHLRGRGLFQCITTADGSREWHVAQPLLFNGGHPGPTRGVPALGGDTAEILERIGLSPAQ